MHVPGGWRPLPPIAARESPPDACLVCGRTAWQSARDLSFTYCGVCGTRADATVERCPCGEGLGAWAHEPHCAMYDYVENDPDFFRDPLTGFDMGGE